MLVEDVTTQQLTVYLLHFWLSQNISNYKPPVLWACAVVVYYVPILNLFFQLHGRTVGSQMWLSCQSKTSF